MTDKPNRGKRNAASEERHRRAGTLAAASLGFAVIQLDVTVVNVAIRQIGSQFGGGTAALQWVVSAYTLMFAALILTAGALSDRFGARRVFSVGFLVFIAGSIASGAAPDLALFIGARAVQGIGAGLLGSSSLALINHTFAEPRERRRALGFWAAGASMALAAGPVIGGLLIAGLGWRSIFFINLPIGLAGLYLTRRFVCETPTLRGHSVDLPGQLLAVVALGSLAGGLIEGGRLGFSEPAVVAAFAVAAAAASGFFLVEARTRQPMPPIAMFRHPSFVGPAVLGLLVNVCFYGLIFVFSLLFQRQDGYSALQAGLAFLPMTAAIMAANLVTSRIGGGVGPRRTIVVGLVCMEIGLAGLIWTGSGTPFWQLVGQQVLIGGGLGLLVPPMTNALLASVDRARSGVAAGTLNTMRQTGSVLGVSLFGSFIATRSGFTGGYHLALAASIGLVAVAALSTRWIAQAD